MPDKVPDDLVALLTEHDQLHVCGWWNDLTASQRSDLVASLRAVDFPLVSELVEKYVKGPSPKGDTRGAKAKSPSNLVRLPRSADEKADRVAARSRGMDLLSAGKVAAMVVAGGQGSRLGFDKPKGMFPIGPVSEKSLFQLHFEQLDALATRVGRRIPYLIMTSEQTDAATKQFLEENEYFGASLHDVYIFRQGWLPAVDEDGRILMSGKGSLAASPDGHGGMLKAVRKSGLLDILADREIEHVYYHQVDNPTAILCDPELLGLHAHRRSEMTTKVVAKTGPQEKMGVVVDIDGKTQIIEYSDLSEAQQSATEDDGTLKLWAGNTAIHVFTRDFLERLTSEGASLQYHRAHKKVGFFDGDLGEIVTPKEPNAFKFEQFIFDALPEAANALVVEADRGREFNPVKNAEGADSPQTAREAIRRIHRSWVEAAGGRIAEGTTVEIGPLYALDAEELAAKLDRREFTKDTVLDASAEL